MLTMLKGCAIVATTATMIAQTLPTKVSEVVEAKFKPVSEGYEITLLTPNPDPLKVTSTQNGQVFKAVISNARLAKKYRSQYGHYIHIGNPAKGIEVLKVYQLKNNQIQACTFDTGLGGGFTLKKAFQRGDTFVLQLAYAKDSSSPVDKTYCKAPN